MNILTGEKLITLPFSYTSMFEISYRILFDFTKGKASANSKAQDISSLFWPHNLFLEMYQYMHIYLCLYNLFHNIIQQTIILHLLSSNLYENNVDSQLRCSLYCH